MQRLYKKYLDEIVPALKEKFGYKNKMAVPSIKKVTLNIGVGHALTDSSYLELVENNLQKISGQKPVKCVAKKSISNFKIREGMVVGVKVTLRKERMYDFLDKLINITFPRIRDFRGVDPKIMDGKGNLTIGFKEHISFPEIQSAGLDKLHGLEISVLTTAKTDKEGFELFKLLGFPFKEKKN